MTNPAPDPHQIARDLTPAMAAALRSLDGEEVRLLARIHQPFARGTAKALVRRGILDEFALYTGGGPWSVHDPVHKTEWSARITALGRAVYAALLDGPVPDPAEPTMAQRGRELSQDEAAALRALGEPQGRLPHGHPGLRTLVMRGYTDQSDFGYQYGVTDMGRAVLDALDDAQDPDQDAPAPKADQDAHGPQNAPEPPADGTEDEDADPTQDADARMRAWVGRRYRMKCQCPNAPIWTSMRTAHRMSVHCNICHSPYLPTPSETT